jgi:hypothetical protein
LLLTEHRNILCCSSLLCTISLFKQKKLNKGRKIWDSYEEESLTLALGSGESEVVADSEEEGLVSDWTSALGEGAVCLGGGTGFGFSGLIPPSQ